MKESSTVNILRKIFFAGLVLFLAVSLVNCGGGSSSGPAQVKAPTALIQDFIAKHTTMVDTSLVDYYVEDEQPTVAAAVNRTIDEKKETGELEKLQQMQFDFSNLQIRVVGQKEGYINDRPRKLMKVSVSGSYVMKQENGAKTVPANDSIVLEMVDNSWKVTEKVDPFKKYQYNKSHG
jgi:hypothetical protein